MVRTIAIFSPKGGVGKTTLAVNLADAAARSGRRTLLWDLDAQAAASWLLGVDDGGDTAAAILAKAVSPAAAIRPTAIDRLDLIPADRSLAALDRLFHDLGKRRRLAKLVAEAGHGHDRLILDCPPGLDATSAQILRAADLVVVPVVPAPLAKRALDLLAETVADPARLLPVLSMVDRRRRLHLDALAAEPNWPVIPMASAIEAATRHRRPSAAKPFAVLWTAIERKLAKLTE